MAEVGAGEGGVVVGGGGEGLEFGCDADGGGEGCTLAYYARGAAVRGGEGVDREGGDGGDVGGEGCVVGGGEDREGAEEA